MATTNRDRIQRMLDRLRDGLAPFVERELKAALGEGWAEVLDERRKFPLQRGLDGEVAWDSQAILKTMVDNWQSVFRNALGHTERAWVGELIGVRNDFAHEQPFSSDDTHRALDTAQRLLMAVSARKQAEAVEAMRQELMRAVYEEQARGKTRKRTLTLESQPRSGLKPWREIVTPHADVASGRYVQAEFAADLAQVYRGEGVAEYSDPVEFFRRTYLTQGLRVLVKSAMQRLSGQGGDPVVELQTNFGGGKTHSMLALYHLFGAPSASSLPGVEELMTEQDIKELPRGRRAVLVGTDLSPAEPQEKPDGTVTHTLWGEMAWQLGGKEAYAKVAKSDGQGISPGSGVLTELLKAHAPCLVLIDEWVAYVRQLYHVNDLPAGTFDSNLTFAQALTEAAKAAPGVMLVASLPASQIEIGGEGGQEALVRLKNTFSRIESAWQPATADEGFEIVRRRLFEPIADSDLFAARDAAIKAFMEMYRSGGNEFPQGCGEGDYRRRMEAAYPIHPELFERLYNDWGSLDKFQRTRGVLRLMASVIHTLWERNDRGLLILPASIPIDDSIVQSELVRYLDQSWSAVIAKDVDGSTSVPLAIDQEIPPLGRYSATRRVARTVYVGSAPTSQSNNPGIDDRRIRLGCAQPGESPSTFGDALRRLADRATYLYQDGSRYWFSTQPSVARLADDRAAEYDEADVDEQIRIRLRKDRTRGDFEGVHIAPDASSDVPDEMDARLVVLGPEHPYMKADGGRALKAAEKLLSERGGGQRLYRNMLVFVAPDQSRLSELRQGMRLSMAWSSIVADHETLNLDAFQRKQAETKKAEFEKTVDARILETWVWAMSPYQEGGRSELQWDIGRLQGQDPLAVRMSKRLAQSEGLLTRYGPARLRMVLDNKELWADADHIGTRKLWEYIASYLYLPRLKNQEVLRQTVEAGIADLANDNFAYAERYDPDGGRYLGLKLGGEGASVVIDSESVLVKLDVARAQAEADKEKGGGEGAKVPASGHPGAGPAAGSGGAEPGEDATPRPVRRFFGTAEVNPERAARDMGKIAEEVLQHLITLPGSKVRVSVEIHADAPEGVPDDIQRVVIENCDTLKFTQKDFERE